MLVAVAVQTMLVQGELVELVDLAVEELVEMLQVDKLLVALILAVAVVHNLEMKLVQRNQAVQELLF
jgi:hypothetical protein